MRRKGRKCSIAAHLKFPEKAALEGVWNREGHEQGGDQVLQNFDGLCDFQSRVIRNGEGREPAEGLNWSLQKELCKIGLI